MEKVDKKGFLAMLFGRGLLAISSLVMARVSTMLLSPAETGRYNILYNFTFLLSLILITPIAMYFNRKIVEWNMEGRSKQYFWYYVWLIVPFGIIGSGAVLLYHHFFGIGITIGMLSLFAFMLAVPLIAGAQNVLLTAINYLEHRITYVFLTNLGNWGGLILATAMALWIAPVAEVWMAGQQIVLLGVCLIGYLYLKKVFHHAEPAPFAQAYAADKSLALNEVFKYSVPYAGSMVLYWIQTYCYQLILNYNSSNEQVGLFATGIKIGQTPLMILDAILFQYFISFYFKDIANSGAEKKAAAWNTFSKSILPLVFPVVIAVLVSAEPLTIILVDKKFIGSKEFVLWGALTEGLRIFSTVISQVAIAEMKMNALFWASLVPAILTLGFQLGLVRHNPTLISGLSLFIGMFSNVIIGLIIARCLLPITFPWKSIGKAIAYSLPMVVLFFYRKNFMGFLFTTFGNEGWKHYLSPMIFLLAVFCLWVLPVLMTLKLRHDE